MASPNAILQVPTMAPIFAAGGPPASVLAQSGRRVCYRFRNHANEVVRNIRDMAGPDSFLLHLNMFRIERLMLC